MDLIGFWQRLCVCKEFYISRFKQFLHILIFLGFNLLGFNLGYANQGSEMNQKSFDYLSYGLVNKNELSIALHLRKEASGPSTSLEFTNVSSRELHIENRLWFTRLKVFANDKPVEYIGPMVSMPPPNKSDFVTLKPGSKFTTEPIKLNSYYGLPDNFNGILKVSFQFSPVVPVSVATLSADH
jgi:hypothetical protein